MGLILRPSPVYAFKYLKGVRAAIGGSAAALVEQYLQQDSGSKRAANVPVSQRFYYTSREQNERTTLSARHQAIQLRLGDARLLTSPERGHHHLNNSNEAHPLFYAETAPRQSGLCEELVYALHQLRIHKLTPLQGALIPLILKGKHVIAHSETGTGKSFGMALAVANRLLREQVNYRLHTLIIVPTEELSLQYEKWLRHFGGASAQIVQVAISSIPLEVQLGRLHNIQPHVLVGTPQRIAELNQLAPTFLNEKLRRRVDCLVLDEADLILTTPIRLSRVHEVGGDGNASHRRGGRAGASGAQVGTSVLDGAGLVDRLFRCRPEEVPAQLVAASATVDSVTARLLNTWTRNDKAVRLTTSFSEHSIPANIQFYFFGASPRYSLPTSLSLVLQLIMKEHAAAATPSAPKPRILLLTSEEEVEDTVSYVCDTVAPMMRKWYDDDQGLHHGGMGRNPSSPHQRSLSPSPSVPISQGVRSPATTGSSSSGNDSAAATQRVEEKKGERGEEEDKTTTTRDPGVRRWPPIAAALHHSHAPHNTDTRRRHNFNGGAPTSPLYRPAPRIVRQKGDVYVKNESALSQWTQGNLLVGVASFESCRGLHVNGVSHVILYGPCPTANTFLHCAGRTGRMGCEGKVIVLFPPSSGRQVQQVCESVEVPFHASKMEEVEKLLRS